MLPTRKIFDPISPIVNRKRLPNILSDQEDLPSPHFPSTIIFKVYQIFRWFLDMFLMEKNKSKPDVFIWWWRFLEYFCLWCQRFRKKSFCQSLGKTMPMIFKVLLLIFQNLTFFPQNLRSSTSFKGCSYAMAQNENFSYFKELTSFSSKLICNYETCPIFFSISG